MYIRVLICISCTVLLLVSWIVAANSKSASEKQLLLIKEATDMMNEDIFIRAVPLLEEAAEYNARHTSLAENELKRAYLALMDKRGFPRRYITLLEKQMNRKNAPPEVFIEAAEYYLSLFKIHDALEIMKSGIEKTGDENIIMLYENSRYAFEISRPAFDNVTEMYNKTIQVQIDGMWGIAGDDGTLIIPCIYDKISNFNIDRAIVKSGDAIYAVDKDNNRVSVADETVIDFNNYANNRVSLFAAGSWVRATGDFETGSSLFEDIKMYSEGYAAAKINNKWGVIGLSDKWLVPAEFDEIISDELGRCFSQDAVFVRNGKSVYLYTKGGLESDAYEDAHPFGKDGFAAVKRYGKWGFINKSGTEVIPFIFEDALSFGQHLAAVKVGEHWGFINKQGMVVIEPVFMEAKSFSEGSAPVLTDRGWQIITLLEYKKGVSL